MKVAILGESSADEAAIRIFIEGILGRGTQPILPHPRLRTRGWPSVRDILPSVLKYLHYQTDAEALVLVVDSNASPPHLAEHDPPALANPACRLCQLRQIVKQLSNALRPVPDRTFIRTVIGLAVPAIEAWYLCQRDARVGETAWRGGLMQGSLPYTNNDLKQSVYGTDRPSLKLETERAVEEANRLAGNLDALERLFPDGFGAFARDVRNWQPTE